MTQNNTDPNIRRKRARCTVQKKTFGPVEDLETHVKPDWWQTLFNSLYLKTDADLLDDMEVTRKEVDLIVSILGLAPEERILDLCCGQGRHVLELARRGFSNVEGYDRSQYLIRKARTRAQKENLQVRFREGDARKLPHPSDTFDVVTILGNSFGYFDSTLQDQKVLEEIFRVLKPGGRVFIDAMDGDHMKKSFQPRSWEWLDRKYFVCRERALSADGDRLICREVISRIDRGVIADQFYAERLYNKESLFELLTVSGFSSPAFHTTFSPVSESTQDAGLMEQRILVSASVEKPWSPFLQSTGNKKPMNIAVVLGDPRKEDLVKPACVFDDDDFDTLEKMKKALAEIPFMRFTFLDRHETLLDDLKKKAAKIDLVLNLCDEGFCNDPTKELHVPALLDQLNIPYTGAGPQCLAFCYDKSIIRGVAREMGIPVAKGMLVMEDSDLSKLSLSFPLLVKPNSGDSSFGITQKSIAYSREELLEILEATREKIGSDRPFLLEEFLPGKDISVGIIGNPPACTVLPITEEDYSAVPDELPKICGYEAKWLPDSPYWNIRSVRADLPEKTRNEIVKCCLALFTRLDCRDYARFDWRLDAKGKPRLLEVNPNPGWCWDGHLAKMAAYANISYSGMLAAVIEAAKERYGLKAAGKAEFSGKMPETTPRKSPAECAAEFEEEIEASNSMDSKNNQEEAVFSDTSETIQVFESI
ncbi:MAG: methyltransferase domain-containing protein [Methanosarcina sp.]|mgnify:FL=1|nr:methyltransferase domain-containing protein [Methanosarcina sp.]MDD3316374.1 methyltransferase domain-containing protein [Methanosarcina sp.]MDD4305618.1 methyltransferase domain-containing protein [Methanosarcina sp.]MDD4619941.1 methyltransferase domain-containing protein [Methanosarcina sp.]NLN44275.1 methyltransferase domain-containing protein [Methanosarcina sp.]